MPISLYQDHGRHDCSGGIADPRDQSQNRIETDPKAGPGNRYARIQPIRQPAKFLEPIVYDLLSAGGASTLAIAAVNADHLERSDLSCFRPAAVN